VKKPVIRAAMEAHLKALGFSQHTWSWLDATAELLLVVNGNIKTMKLKAGMSQRALTFEMGRIQGWSEVLGLKPKPNGAGIAPIPDPHQLALPIPASA
jgi:hypothetical protein